MSNIEIGTMNEENKPGAVKGIIKSGMELEKQRIEEENLLINGTEPVIMTEITINGDTRVESGNLIVRPDSQLSNSSESPIGSFLSIECEQSSEEKENVPDTSITDRVKILKFEDTLTDEDSSQVEIMYDSLLMEGEVGNLTKTTLEIVLAQKPPAWLQVMYERLKHLIISSETFRERKERYVAKGKVKLSKKPRFRVNKGQRRLKVGNSSNPWPKITQTKTVVKVL